MIANTAMKFIIRWLITSLGLWIAAALLGPERLSVGGELFTVLVAGLVLALVNTVIKPFLIILSLPAILLTLGLFMIFLNGVLVYIASKLYEPLFVSSIWVAVVAGLVIGLVNYLVTRIFDKE